MILAQRSVEDVLDGVDVIVWQTTARHMLLTLSNLLRQPVFHRRQLNSIAGWLGPISIMLIL